MTKLNELNQNNQLVKLATNGVGELAQYCVKNSKLFDLVERQQVWFEKDFCNKYIEKEETAEMKKKIADRQEEIRQEAINDTIEAIKDFIENSLNPMTAKIENGATVCFYSDSHAHTIIDVKKNGKQITLQRDNAELDNWKPEIIAGGFAGHCVNQNTQKYKYSRNTNGSTVVANWSEKYNRYFVGGTNGNQVIGGRHEFYDYNF